jgi:hypothetical protein
MTAWIDHVKAYAKKNGCTYKEALSKARATYKPSAKMPKKKGGAMPCIERKIGGAKMMPLKQVKSEVKSLGHKLSRVVNGVRKAYNKSELVKMLVDKGVEKMAGGKVNRMKKAVKWTKYAEDTAKKGIGLAKEIKGLF